MRTNDLLANIINKNDKNIGLVVSDKNNTQSSKIYSTVPSNTKMKSITSADLNTFGQIWSVSLVGDGGIMPTGDDSRPSTILAGGIAISFITSVAVYLLIQFRTRSFALAEEHRLQQAKDELLSLASHQLRTPATGVKQYIGMVLDGFAGKVSKRQVELLQQAYKSNERQLQIINEFLYVAKLGSGSLTTAEHRFDLAPLVRDVVSEMKGDIEEKQHDVVVTAPKRLMTRADEHSVRMIVENLISNAVKYTHAKGEISVELKRTGPEARVVVRDNGIGIARKDMQMLFKQFSRIPNEMSSDVSGSGIGLYLAQQLAARNGGLITVESEQGKGSSFILHLPIKTVKNITKTPDEA
jgi:signal transduction histidine kinase